MMVWNTAKTGDLVFWVQYEKYTLLSRQDVQLTYLQNLRKQENEIHKAPKLYKMKFFSSLYLNAANNVLFLVNR